MRPDVHRLVSELEAAIEAGDAVRAQALIVAAELRRGEGLDVARLLSRPPGVELRFGLFDEAHLAAA